MSNVTDITGVPVDLKKATVEDLTGEASVAANVVRKFFHIATMLSIYERDGKLAQRHVNLLMETDDGNVTKEHLQNLNASAIQRLRAENDVQHEQVKDLIVLSITLLGWMTQEEFYGKIED